MAEILSEVVEAKIPLVGALALLLAGGIVGWTGDVLKDWVKDSRTRRDHVNDAMNKSRRDLLDELLPVVTALDELGRAGKVYAPDRIGRQEGLITDLRKLEVKCWDEPLKQAVKQFRATVTKALEQDKPSLEDLQAIEAALNTTEQRWEAAMRSVGG